METPSSDAQQKEYADVVKHMRGDYAGPGVWTWAGIGGAIGGAIAFIGSLFLKSEHAGAETPALQGATTAMGAFVGSAIGMVIKISANQQEMDEKAAKVLFKDRIQQERETATRAEKFR